MVDHELDLAGVAEGADMGVLAHERRQDVRVGIVGVLVAAHVGGQCLCENHVAIAADGPVDQRHASVGRNSRAFFLHCDGHGAGVDQHEAVPACQGDAPLARNHCLEGFDRRQREDDDISLLGDVARAVGPAAAILFKLVERRVA